MKRVNESIEKEEWKGYFMGLLGGVGEVVRMGTGDGKREGKERERSKKEIREVVFKLSPPHSRVQKIDFFFIVLFGCLSLKECSLKISSQNSKYSRSYGRWMIEGELV